MCYAIPGKVIEIKDKAVTVEYFGERKKALNEIDGLKVGDYIYAQGGYVIKQIPEKEAHAILATWKETFFELHETDLRLSRLDLQTKGIDRRLGTILDKAAEGGKLKDEELLYLLNREKQEELDLLYKVANFLRAKHLGNSCCVHGIVEFSNYCSQACSYCGISAHNQKITRYRMTKEEIVAAAFDAVENKGFKALVLQSGEDPFYSVDDLCEIIHNLKARCAVLIFISCGEVGIEGLQKLYAAGARGLLMRFETSNPKQYLEIHPGRELASRIEHLEAAYKTGYLIITGGLIGLPGQTREDLLNDILLAKKLNTEMYTFGPFLPHPETPLAKVAPPPIDEVLKVLAVSRISNPENAKILVTTGFETLNAHAREKGLMAGANSVMLNVTPKAYAKNYQIYPDRAHSGEDLQGQIEKTLSLLMDLGRAPTDLGAGITG